MPSRFTRRKLLSYGFGALVAASGIDGFLIEPGHAVAERVDIRLARLPEAFHGFRIAHLSDIHFGPYMDQHRLQRAMSIAQSFQPDMVALTGDFVSHPFARRSGPAGARMAGPCGEVIAQCKGMPLIAVLGNHDHWNGPEIVAGDLGEHGIRVLRNESLALERSGERLWIAGVDDVFERKADLPRTLSRVPKDEATLLLAHEPDFADDAAKSSIDLQLSGHSHGGQVQIPGIGPIILPTLAHKYPIALNRVGNLQVYTTRGVGLIDPPVRFNCPPEVTLITLMREGTQS